MTRTRIEPLEVLEGFTVPGGLKSRDWRGEVDGLPATAVPRSVLAPLRSAVRRSWASIMRSHALYPFPALPNWPENQ